MQAQNDPSRSPYVSNSLLVAGWDWHRIGTQKARTAVVRVSGSMSTPGRIRTSNPRFRRPVLYPIELRAQARGTLPQGDSPIKPVPDHSALAIPASPITTTSSRFSSRENSISTLSNSSAPNFGAFFDSDNLCCISHLGGRCGFLSDWRHVCFKVGFDSLPMTRQP